MRLRKMGICRGDGKIFIKYEVSGCKDAPNIELKNSTDDGGPLPCNLYVSDSATNAKPAIVAVIPNIPITQNLTFSETNERGDKDHASQRISFNQAKWESRLNYRINKELTEEIRNYDESARDCQIFVGFSEVIPTGDVNKVRVTLEIPHDKKEDISVKYSKSGKCWHEAKIIWLGEQEIRPQMQNLPRINEARFSMDIPKTEEYILIDIRDNANIEFSNFAVLEPNRLKEMQNFWFLEHECAAGDPGYPEWFEKKRVKAPELALQSCTTLELESLFSIIVPLYKTPIPYFKEMAESVAAQSYKNWELILVNSSPEDETLASAISQFTQHDERIKAFNLDENLGISGNTREGLKLATGDYVCFLDHDDTLEPNALFEYAKAISEDADIDLIYCDEDKIMPNGNFGRPYFKPDFSIDLLRSVNYICHLLCIRKNLLESLEPSTVDADGAQDHDLILKATEKTSSIHHIPQVLYHWRTHEQSSSINTKSKEYASIAGAKVIDQHLKRMGLTATIQESSIPFTYDVNYIPNGNPLVSIVIPNKDNHDVLNTCITSILSKSSYQNYEIVIVENNSTEEATFEHYDKLKALDPRIKIEKWPGEFNFSKIVNYGTEKSQGEYLILLNNDTEVITPDWIERMLGYCQREDVGIVGVRLWYPDNTIQHAGVGVPLGEGAGHFHLGFPRGQYGYFGLIEKTQNLSAVTAACIMTKRSTYDAVNGFDENFKVAYNDVDFCLKVREASKLVVYLPSVELYHYESLSRGAEINREKQARFVQEKALLQYKWPYLFVDGNPFFNPNLSPDSCHYALNWRDVRD